MRVWESAGKAILVFQSRAPRVKELRPQERSAAYGGVPLLIIYELFSANGLSAFTGAVAGF